MDDINVAHLADRIRIETLDGDVSRSREFLAMPLHSVSLFRQRLLDNPFLSSSRYLFIIVSKSEYTTELI